MRNGWLLWCFISYAFGLFLSLLNVTTVPLFIIWWSRHHWASIHLLCNDCCYSWQDYARLTWQVMTGNIMKESCSFYKSWKRIDNPLVEDIMWYSQVILSYHKHEHWIVTRKQQAIDSNRFVERPDLLGKSCQVKRLIEKLQQQLQGSSFFDVLSCIRQKLFCFFSGNKID